MPEVAPMLMVEVEVGEVEAGLRGGLLGCPSCAGVLAPWGFARERAVRGFEGGLLVLRPRRARCRGCERTHVLLPDACFLRRQYEADVIGAAFERNARGEGYRRIACELGVPVDTVRSWLRRLRERAEAIRSHFVRFAYAIDPELEPITGAGSLSACAVEAIGVAARAWVLRFGGRGAWRLASWMSGGLLIATPGSLFPAVA